MTRARSRRRGLRLLAAVTVVCVAAGVGGGVAFYTAFLHDLPDLHRVEDYRPLLASHVLDRDGRVIGEFFEERRRLVPIDEIPEAMIQAIVAGEDDAFFEHEGLDYGSILRAAWVNFTAGRTRQGASTITQQVAKSLLLSPERSLRRKLKDMILARRIEQRLTKDEILYLYLNQIYFGHGAYGIGEAARVYFGKEARELTLSECALLAGLPQRPSDYSPVRDPEAAERRRRYVLRRMHEERYLSDAEYAEALADRPVLSSSPEYKSYERAAYFTEEVRRYLSERLGDERLLRDGLVIETTLDMELQQEAVEAVRSGLRELDHRIGYRGPERRVTAEAIPGVLQRLAERNGFAETGGGAEEDAGGDARATPRAGVAPGGARFAEAGAGAEESGPEEPPEAGRPAGPAATGAPSEPEPLWLPLDETIHGVVTAVDAGDGTAAVAFGPDRRGIVHLEDVSWAREPNPARRPRPVSSIDEVFRRGDVAAFRVHPELRAEVRAEAGAAGGAGTEGASNGDRATGDGPDAGAPDSGPERLVLDGEPARVVLFQEPRVQGALLALDVHSGDVLAMVGGYDFDESQFNRTTQARRQPGSAFKPIVYAAALERGYTPVSVLWDRPYVAGDAGSGLAWRPRNYGRRFHGQLLLREALARSVNNATIHLASEIGVGAVVEEARRLGIESPLARNLSLALGSSSISLLELVRAYATFPAQGRRVEPRFITRVLDREGSVLLENVSLGADPEAAGEAAEGDDLDRAAGTGGDAGAAEASADGGAAGGLPPGHVMAPETAFLMTDLLRGVVEDPRGTGRRARSLGHPVGGKTGTTNEQADAWFVGFSADIATGVWTGFDEEQVLGSGETGGRAALPMWIHFMKAALADRAPRDFPVPPGVVFARIDRETGLLARSSGDGTFFQPFAAGTEPTETAARKVETSESERLLRLDAF